MLTEQDIKSLSDLLDQKLDSRFQLVATKQDVGNLQDEVGGLRDSVQSLATSVDGLVKVIEDLRLEYVSIKIQLDRHERWIKEIAEKASVKLSS